MAQMTEFEPRTCDRLISPPFVCNGCENERICPLPKKFYVAKVAQADRDSKLHESRKGVHATNKQIEEMNVAVKDGLGKRFKRHAERIILRKNGVTK